MLNCTERWILCISNFSGIKNSGGWDFAFCPGVSKKVATSDVQGSNNKDECHDNILAEPNRKEKEFYVNTSLQVIIYHDSVDDNRLINQVPTISCPKFQ